MFPKHNVQDIDKCIGNAVHPIAKVVAVVEKIQTMNRKKDMKTRVIQVISISVKDRR